MKGGRKYIRFDGRKKTIFKEGHWDGRSKYTAVCLIHESEFDKNVIDTTMFIAGEIMIGRKKKVKNFE